MKKHLGLILSILITLLFTLVLYYVVLPPLNPTSMSFWACLILIVVCFLVTFSFGKFQDRKNIIFAARRDHKSYIVIPIAMIGLLGVLLLINFVLSPLFQSKQFAKRIQIKEDGNFTSDIAQVNFKHLPLLDRDSSEKLGDRVMGQMPELVSQFQVSNLYTQINYKDDIVRVTPLEYNGFIKYLTNMKSGVKGYITVNSVTGESNLVKLDQGMKYMPSAHFFQNLDRKLRLTYPTAIFGEKNFEIDNDGKPYWIIPTIKYTGIEQREEINGVIILDPVTGESKRYKVKDVPKWVDHVYSANLIIEQTDDWGRYKNGFFNSIFGQKNVVKTTRGYNYIAMNDDVYLYTGITSTTKDEATVGFILCNMRTKETVFYAVPGAEEYSAMASAQGQVQQMNYTSTFPLLINLNNRPTYMVSLKDNAGLVKMYGFIDVVDYQKVVVTESSKGIEVAANNYLKSFGSEFPGGEAKKQTITIKEITSASINGTSYYYLTDTEGKKYRISISVDDKNIPFLKSGQKVTISYYKAESVTEITELEL